MSPAVRKTLLKQSIADAVPLDLKRTGRSDWDDEFLQVQLERLESLLERWFDECELTRAPFTSMCWRKKPPSRSAL